MNRIGQRIIRVDETDSTNLRLQSLSGVASQPEGTVLVAGYQRKGKGAGRASWLSERGENLLFSVLLNPIFLPPSSQFWLNKAFSLAVHDLVKGEAPEGVSVKWPNDIYHRKKKLAGILFSNSITGDRFDQAIAGIGLNVNQAGFPPGLPNPVSLKNITGKHYDLEELLDRLLVRLNERYAQLKEGRFSLLDGDYSACLYLYGTRAKYRYRGKLINASIRGVNDFGHLLLDSDELGQLECDLKEVEYLL